MAASTNPASNCRDLGSWARPGKTILETMYLSVCDTNLVKMLLEPRRAFPNIGAQPPPDNRPGKGY